jgi:hypothetical protein
MDAYDIKNQIHTAWQSLSVMPCPASLVKEFTEVPVYVQIDNILLEVAGVKEIDGKIILTVKE